ncbi:MAG: glycosyltransferase family 39 protein, partial [Candidatus Hydrothermarchaeaceae archaeon]
ITNWGASTNALGDYLVLGDLPAVPLLYGLIFKFFGESRVYLQIFSTLLFASTVVITYLIGKRLWSRNTGIYAGVLLLGSPYLLSKSSLTLVEIPLMFFLAAAIYTTLNALESERNKVWIVASAVFIFLTFSSKLSAWPMLAAIPAIFLTSYMKSKDRAVLYRSVSVALLSGVMILAFVLYKIDIFAELPAQIGSFSMLQMHRYAESPLSLLFFQISPLVTLLALYSLYIAFRKRDMDYLLLLVWALLPFVLLHNSRIRYMVPALPAIAIMASIALGEIRTEKTRKFLAFSIVLCSLSLGVFYYLPFTHSYSTANIKNAADFTNSLNVDAVEFYAVFPDDYRFNLNILLSVFDIYSSKKVKTPEYWPVETKPPPAGWTWRFVYPPPYYSQDPGPANAIVIVSPGIGQVMPENLEYRLGEYKLSRIYSAGEISSLGPYIAKVYLPNPIITVTSPGGGVALKAGTVFNVTWGIKSPTETYLAFLVNAYSPSTDTYQMINWTDTHWYEWRIDPQTFPPADDYRVRIQGSDDDWRTYYFADSETFSIG